MRLYDFGILLILIYLFITFIISAYEKVGNWEETKTFYSDMFKTVFSSNTTYALLILVFIGECIVSSMLGFAIYQCLYGEQYEFISYALIACMMMITILMLGLRLIKDYRGSAQTGIYFLIAAFGFYLQ